MGPKACKYCGCDKFNADSVTMTRFRCGSSYWSQDEVWQIANGCAAKCAVQLVELRATVQRAIGTLKAAKRYRVSPVTRKTIEWEETVDGIVTDSAAVDEALVILEGERDGETWHAYTEPPNDTRSVMLRFDPQGNRDCQGFYSYDFESYARNEPNARRLKFVHPTHWRELTEGER